MKYIRRLIVDDKEFYRKVFFLALPIAMQSMITIGVNMLDTIMVGKLGEDSLSATSLANSFISIYHIFCMELGFGQARFCAYLSRQTVASVYVACGERQWRI